MKRLFLIAMTAAVLTGCTGSSSGGPSDACESIRHQIQRDKAAVTTAQQTGDDQGAAEARADVEADARAARDRSAVGGACDISDLVGDSVGR